MIRTIRRKYATEAVILIGLHKPRAVDSAFLIGYRDDIGSRRQGADVRTFLERLAYKGFQLHIIHDELFVTPACFGLDEQHPAGWIRVDKQLVSVELLDTRWIVCIDRSGQQAVFGCGRSRDRPHYNGVPVSVHSVVSYGDGVYSYNRQRISCQNNRRGGGCINRPDGTCRRSCFYNPEQGQAAGAECGATSVDDPAGDADRTGIGDTRCCGKRRGWRDRIIASHAQLRLCKATCGN